jgi:hypothetical protein
MSLYDLSEFFRLSSALNYSLSPESLNRYNILMLIAGGRTLDSDEVKELEYKSILMEALSYLFNAYQQKRRRLGPMAVLHPLRSTALLVRAMDRFNLIDLLTSLFHDILEDVRSSDHDIPKWKALEEQLYHLMDRIDRETEDDLVHRLLSLTRRDQESYYHYIERLLDEASAKPQLVQTKLADRLDNTLDMRIDLQDPLEGIDFFKNIFQILFVKTYKGYRPKAGHPPPAAMSGDRRLFQLFKNVVLLSLLRQKPGIAEDPVSRRLFNSLCEASLKEAERSYVHLIGYHHQDLGSQRALLLNAMNYCYSGRGEVVTRPDDHQLLDGLFTTYFGPISKQLRDQRLEILYQNKPLMMQASIAFIVIFLNFINDPKFYVRGISPEGIQAG